MPDHGIEQSAPPFVGEPPRRGFLKKLLAMAAGAAAFLTPLAVGLTTSFHPLRRKAAGVEEGFTEVTPLASLPADGLPRKFTITADRRDAWTQYDDVPVGAVYLRRTDDGRITAFNASCPHAGCFVNVTDDGSFKCPCHASEFAVNGQIKPVTSGGKRTVSPRGLDELEAKVSDDGRYVLVKFQNYLAGHEEKIPVG